MAEQMSTSDQICDRSQQITARPAVRQLCPPHLARSCHLGRPFFSGRAASGGALALQIKVSHFVFEGSRHTLVKKEFIIAPFKTLKKILGTLG